MSTSPRFPDHHVAREDPSPAELAALDPGTELEPEGDGQPRYVCSCHLVRHRVVFGRSAARVVWFGILVPLVGLGLIVLAGLVVVRATPVAAVVAGSVVALLATGCLVAGRANGHRGWCAARCSAYWFLAFPSLLLGALSSF